MLGTGFVGAYTTFSTWMLETHELVREAAGAALANMLGSLVLGLAAAQLGIGVGAARVEWGVGAERAASPLDPS